jgi:hypothetical protein
MVGLRFESASSLLKASLIWDSTILDAALPQMFMYAGSLFSVVQPANHQACCKLLLAADHIPYFGVDFV